MAHIERATRRHTVKRVVGALIILFALLLASAGVWAIVNGCRTERRDRIHRREVDMVRFLAEVGAWLEQQQ